MQTILAALDTSENLDSVKLSAPHHSGGGPLGGILSSLRSLVSSSTAMAR